nr:hypothetical protein [Tanacetum cinerariifolium]
SVLPVLGSSDCWAWVRESSRLFVIIFPSRSMGGVDTCLHLSLLGLGFILCFLLPQDTVTHTIDTVVSVLTQRELDHFCNTYNILVDLGPELPGYEDKIRDAPAGKIGIYTWFLKFANFRVSDWLQIISGKSLPGSFLRSRLHCYKTLPIWLIIPSPITSSLAIPSYSISYKKRPEN